MNILVCIKQVPNTQAIAIDPKTNTLIREGVESILNPFDGYALEAAARLQDEHPEVRIYTLSMGPPQAEAVLRESLAIAADTAYLISDPLFGGSDTLATSYILSQGIQRICELEGISFAMIFCGKQAIDGDTAQVGPQIAERLDLPQVTCGLTCELVESALKVIRETDQGREIVLTPLPCLVTFTKPSFEPRFATARRRIASRKAEITRLGCDDLPGIDRSRVGLTGSPTRVLKTYVPQIGKDGIILSDFPLEEATRQLASFLREKALPSGSNQAQPMGTKEGDER
ncbi:MAG: electron transfer flavoprotein subunit beta/FixA family protein [Symbiobacteriaceae bacterium]|nr:electron transfer flavoprotein subunit beta/FixA family protein [Symbiobacteriaceae bacterium]